jgi:hypothetical protein
MVSPILSQWLWFGYGLVMVAHRLIDGFVMVGWQTGVNIKKTRTTPIKQNEAKKMIQQTHPKQTQENEMV